MEKKKTLLEKYEIPLGHLDFGYIADCNDSREMEKIVQILRSGEEGHFPDLTRSAENKLRALKPNSRLFRYEEPIRGRDCLSKSEWKPIYDWTNDIKVKDHKLEVFKSEMENDAAKTPLELCLPPVRKGGKITHLKEGEGGDKKGDNPTSTGNANSNVNRKSTDRIKSTDYGKWDKYDPDIEMLRMDLADERVQEEVERKNRLNIQKSLEANKKSNKADKTDPYSTVFSVLNDVERENLAEDHRLRGNEYFRVKEYEQAVEEYGRAIQINPQSAAPAYNNRAIAHIKMSKYTDAMSDAEACLNMEPNNIKARLRLAEASYGYGRRRESYDLYLKVLELDADNATALKAIADLRNEFFDLPPVGATRLKIIEEKPISSKVKEKKKAKVEKPKPAETTKKKSKEYDLAELVVPNRIVKSKLITAAEALTNLSTKPTTNAEQTTTTNRNVMPMPCGEGEGAILRMPAHTKHAKSVGKMLIEEI